MVIFVLSHQMHMLCVRLQAIHTSKNLRPKLFATTSRAAEVGILLKGKISKVNTNMTRQWEN